MNEKQIATEEQEDPLAELKRQMDKAKKAHEARDNCPHCNPKRCPSCGRPYRTEHYYSLAAR